MLSMLTFLVVLSALVWVPVLLHHVMHRAFAVLLIWICIAPVVTNVVAGRTNPFFRMQEDVEKQSEMTRSAKGKITNSNIKMKELLEPSRALFGIFLFTFLLGALVKRQPLLPLDRAELWMAIFAVILLVNTIMLSYHLAHSLRNAVDAFIIPFLAYYVTRRLVTSEEHYRQLIRMLCSAGLFVIMCCLVERLMHGGFTYRLNGPFGGVTQIFVVLTAIWYAMLDGTPTHQRVLRKVLLYGIPVIIVLTWTRGNWLGLLAGLWVFVFLGRRYIPPAEKLGGVGVTLLGIPVMILAIAATIPSEVLDRRVANTNTADFRLQRWIVAIEGGLKSPVFGIGMNNTRELYGQTLKNYFSSHNSFVSLFAELGIVGFLTYMAIVKSIVLMGLRLYRHGAYIRDRWRGISVVAAMVAFQVSGIFFAVFHSADLGNMYIFIFFGGVAGLYSRHYTHALDKSRSESLVAPVGWPRPSHA